MKSRLFLILTSLVLLVALLTGILTVSTAETTGSGSVSVHAFRDGDHNAERSLYEQPFLELYVELLRVENGTETLISATDVDAEGVARFDGLADGVYRIRTTCPEGFGYSKKSNKKKQWTSNIMAASGELTQTSCDLTVSAGQTMAVGVAIRLMASVSGFVWLDEDCDGICNNNEGGAAGAVLELKGTKNDFTYTLTTDETGKYCFTQVVPGSYKLYCTIPAGTAFTKYSETGGTMRSIFTKAGKTRDAKTIDVSEHLTLEDQNVGVVRESRITGICYLDANYNGEYDDGEPALSGVKLELSRQSTSKPLATITSKKDGSFAFDGLRSYVYKLRAVLPTGHFFTKLSNAEKGNKFRHLEDRREFSLTDIKVDNEGNLVLYIGAVAPASISGMVYFDSDFSGTKNGKESVASGISVGLYTEAGERIAAVKTSMKGKYIFEDVPPGYYYLTAIAKSGYAFTKTGAGNVLINTGNGTGASEPFWIDLKEKKTGADIGMILPGTVQGSVFGDANDNGRKDAGETGLAGTVVSLMSDEGAAFTTTLDSAGTYCFDAVMPGRYCVHYELPENAVFTTAVSGVLPDGSAANTKWFDFAMGDKKDIETVGGVLLGSLSGTAFDDLNADGLNTENALSGMVITLTPSRSDLAPVSAASAADGSFALTGLHPDTYVLSIVWPEGYVQSRTAGTSLPVHAGLAEQKAELTVSMGDSWVTEQLGGVKPASLSGKIWLDTNCNGLMDSDEPGASGEVIRVIDLETNSTFAMLTTASDGSFATAGLVPGSYRLEYELDANTLQVPAGDSRFSESNGLLVMNDLLLTTGDEMNGLLMGIIRYTTIGGHVWQSIGADTVPVSGAVVTLSGAANATITTGEDGNYVFGKLLPGTYQLSVRMPDGATVVEPDDVRLQSGSLISVITSAAMRNGSSDPFVLEMGNDLTGMDIGSVLPGKLGDRAWLDLNGNGLQDIGEEGIPGLTITLMRNGEELATTVTDQYGFYFFSNLYPATYTLRVAYPAEIRPTVLRSDFPALASVLLEDGSGTIEVTVESDRRNFNADLGFVLTDENVFPAGYGEGATVVWNAFK